MVLPNVNVIVKLAYLAPGNPGFVPSLSHALGQEPGITNYGCSVAGGTGQPTCQGVIDCSAPDVMAVEDAVSQLVPRLLKEAGVQLHGALRVLADDGSNAAIASLRADARLGANPRS